ncbi:MAG: hypothetical protein HQL56_01095 [Magnetococcales bacterium]|nr:hypothetical protein [Magnetococcales bacterium]
MKHANATHVARQIRVISEKEWQSSGRNEKRELEANNSQIALTPKDVAKRLKEAVLTLRQLPMKDLKPPGYRSNWPDVVHDAAEAYGYDDSSYREDPPTAAAITQMDEAINWLCCLDKNHTRLVWMVADEIPWKKICRCFGISRATANRRWKYAIGRIVQFHP